jgi:hypothetical protein
MLVAANQVGKTFCAGAEVAMHLTGQYPDWWQGKRFDRPNHWLAGSESGELTRRGVQRILLGRDIKTELGTGSIPAKAIISTTAARGVPGLIDTAVIQHASGGRSTVSLKSYDEGRAKWQADTVDGIWFDEEPPAGCLYGGPYTNEHHPRPHPAHADAASRYVRCGRQIHARAGGRHHIRYHDG